MTLNTHPENETLAKKVANLAQAIHLGENPQGKFLWSDEDDAYLCDQDTYDWWAEYIENAEQTEIEARDLAERLGVSYTQVIDRIRQHTGLDYDQHRQEAIAAMLDLEAECEPNPPAYVQGGEWVESL